MYIEGYVGDRHSTWRENLGLAGKRLIYSVTSCFVLLLAFASLLAERDRDLLELQVALSLYQAPKTRQRALQKIDNMAHAIISKVFLNHQGIKEHHRYYVQALSIISPARFTAITDAFLGGKGEASRRAHKFLFSINDRSVLPVLYRQARKERAKSNEKSWQKFLDRMFVVDREATHKLLAKKAAKENPLAVRLDALDALLYEGSHPSREVLACQLNDKEESPFIRRRSLKHLFHFSRRPAPSTLRKLIEEEDRELRRLAGRQLLALGPIAPEERLKVFCALHWNDVRWFEETLEETGQGTLDELIDDMAKKYELEPALVRAVIRAESNFNPTCVSSAGAQGLMQLMPKTAKLVGVKDPFDPKQNVLGGMRYLKRMFDRFNGNLTLALAAYNAGPTAVSRYKGVPPYRETKRYVWKVKTFLAQYRNGQGLKSVVKLD